jgi:hypothetical protein
MNSDDNNPKTSFLQNLKDSFIKPKLDVSQELLTAHEEHMVQLRFLSKMAYVIDSNRFDNEEFRTYIKLDYHLTQEAKGYEGLRKPSLLVKTGIHLTNSYVKISEIEINSRGSKQQELYLFVNNLLNFIDNEVDSTEAFLNQLKKKIEEINPQLKSEEGRLAIKSYANELELIANNEMGLRLLKLIKSGNFEDYLIFKRVRNMSLGLKKLNVLDFKILLTLVMGNFELFQKLGSIVGIPQSQNTAQTYAIILQYISLEVRQKILHQKFLQLIQIMRQWQKPYELISNLRNKINSKEYKIPKEFLEPIHGIDIYNKYISYIKDKKYP